MSSSVGVRVANVPWMATALKRCIVIDSRWKRNAHQCRIKVGAVDAAALGPFIK